MKKRNKVNKDSILTIMGKYVEKYLLAYIIVMCVMIIFEIIYIIYWNYDESTYGVFSDTMYLVLSIFFLALSVIYLGLMIISKLGKLAPNKMAILLHIYSFLLFVWATFFSILDLDSGISPLIYMIVSMLISGILIIEPIFYTIMASLSIVIIIVCDSIYNYQYFNGNGEIFNFVLYIILVVLLGYKHFNVTIKEARIQKRLEELTYYDDLTGLLNERSYMMEVDKLTKEIASGKRIEFGIVVMDVNNVKVTNDMYGHHFGCHLIVTCGHTLPTIFKHSKLFHVGGDEFISILYGEDYKNIEKLIEEFDNKMTYSIIEHNEHELIFSIARGYSIYHEGQDYRTTFQKADMNMYENKVAIKTKYNMKSR